MAEWSPWRACKSSGELPDSLLPASYVQLRYFLQLQADTRYLEDTIGLSTWQGRWRWTISSSAGNMAANVFDLFDQTVDMETDLVYYKTSSVGGLSGALSFFTWWWNDAALKVYTWLPQPARLLSGYEGGRPDGAGGWILSERERGWPDPGGYPPGDTSGDGTPEKSGMTDHEVYVSLWYYSQPYELQLSAGACLDVPFATVGARIESFVHGHWNEATASADAPKMLIKRANVHLRTIAGGKFGAMVDGPGFHRLGRAIPRGAEQVWSADRRNYFTRRIPRALTSLCVGKDRTNALSVHGQWSDRWVVLRSLDDGLTWEAEAMTFEDGYSDGRFVVARDGEGVAIARRGDYLWCRTSRDGYASTARIGPARSACELAIEPGTDALIATDGKATTFVSRDGGRTWSTTEWGS